MNPTLIGFSAVLMWSLLALFTAASGTMPPFQLMAITFAIGGLAGLAFWPVRGVRLSAMRLPWQVWATGIGGLFGYHFFYYTALRNAPVAEASLIAYLWPMLIVLGSALLPGERLRWYHVAGALCGFAGAAMLVLNRGRRARIFRLGDWLRQRACLRLPVVGIFHCLALPEIGADRCGGDLLPCHGGARRGLPPDFRADRVASHSR